jgi:hypothetical protein
MPPTRAERRCWAYNDADVHLGYPIAVGSSKVNLLLDIFNILNMRWTF